MATVTPASIARQLLDAHHRVAAKDFRGSQADVREPGLYAWFVDEAGAIDLTAGLGHDIAAGLIYAGQAGAVFGSKTSDSTLHSRITTNHLGGNIRSSTFRFTLAAALAPSLALATSDHRRLARDAETRLSEWTKGHLWVATVAVEARVLDGVETAVLDELNPPLNLDKMASSPLRTTLKAQRRRLGAS